MILLEVDRYLFNNIKGIYRLLKERDYDWWTMIIGEEGMGKSTFAIIYNYVYSKIAGKDFNVKNITFTADEFLRRMIKAKKTEAVNLDEGSALFVRDNMRRENKETVKKITQIRYRNLFVNICVPDPYIVDSYVRANRIRTLIRIPSRGVFEFYSKSKIKLIKRDPITKKTIYPRPNFVGTFPQITKEMPKLYKLWKAYIDKKSAYILTNYDAKLWKAKNKLYDKMKNAYTVNQVLTLLEAFGRRPMRSTILKWIREGYVPKREVFYDIYDEIRITKKGVEKMIENKIKAENKRRGSMKKALKLAKIRI